MKKKLIILIGIIVLLVCVGLSGCDQFSNAISSTDIRNHPNNYIGKTVVLIGKYYGGLIFDSGGTFDIVIPDIVQKPTPLVTGGTYKFTGIVRYGQVPGSYYAPTTYLEVTKIETT